MKHAERIEQMKLVALLHEFYPDLLFWHTPNGEDRNRRVAINLSRMGVRAGVPDLFFPPLALFIELKEPGGSGVLSAAQVYCHEVLRLAGYRVDVYDSHREAFCAIQGAMIGRGACGFACGLPGAGR